MTSNEAMEADDEFIKEFRKHLQSVDAASNAILRGHLEVEKYLDVVVDLIFFHPEYFRKVKLEFSEKILIAKAYCPDPHARDWTVIKCLNEARNSIAHRRTDEVRAAKILAVRKSISGYGTKEFQKEVAGVDEKEVVVLASALSCGFLTYLEDSVRKVRRTISESLNAPEPSEAEG